eukprot:383791-Prymnesium_polylepis.2
MLAIGEGIRAAEGNDTCPRTPRRFCDTGDDGGAGGTKARRSRGDRPSFAMGASATLTTKGFRRWASAFLELVGFAVPLIGAGGGSIQTPVLRLA